MQFIQDAVDDMERLVVNDMERLLEDEESYDVIIYAGKHEEEIRAHSNVLRIRSQYFHTVLNEWTEKKDGKFALKEPNISPQIFKIILRFIYCGTMKLQGPDVLKTLVAAYELMMETLISHIQKYLIKHQNEFLQQYPIEILETLYQDEIFTDLLNYFLEKICRKPEILFNSDNKFIGLKEPLLELLLKRDDLVMDEIVIWDSLIKWSFAQHPSIQQDSKKWNKEEMSIMERTLNKFIPLIRFCHISPEVLRIKVSLFEEIIPKGLFAQNLRPRLPRFIDDSVLIDSEHFVILSCWIEIRNVSYYNIGTIPFDFILLYRASRDGNTAAEFHNKCDNKGTNIVIAKIKNSVQIVGGYNLHSNHKINYRNDSFIFSFVSRNTQKGQVDYRNHGNYISFGPTFGDGSELMCRTNWDGEPDSHPKVDGIPTGDFYVDDYEVFQVIRKYKLCHD